MRLIVTGGAGFIGSNFIRFMLGLYPDLRIVNVDKLTYAGNRLNLKDVENDPRYRFIKADICDTKKLEGVFKKADAVINFAAESHVDRSINKSSEFIRTNISGTENLLRLSLKFNVSRFIQISTDEVYGSIRKGKADECADLKPSSPYSASKAGADLLALSFFKTFGLPVLITRSSNNFGPLQYPEKIIPLFITNLIEGRKVPLYGKGKNIRDWIYVEDNCRAIELILRKGKPGQIYNISTQHPMNNFNLARLILKKMGQSSRFINFVKDRLGHDFRYAVDVQKLKSLGFSSTVSFEENLQRTINWYIVNYRWWKPLKRY